MNLSTTCPKCKHVNDHTIELNHALEQIAMPDFNDVVKEPEFTIKLKPQNYFAVNRSNSVTYKEQRLLDTLSKADTEITPEDREKNLKAITEELVDLNVDNLTSSTEYILMSDGTRVTDTAFIKEFYSNTSSALIRKVQDKLGEIANGSGLKPYNNTCVECSAEYKTEVTFDYASFFGVGS
jgi:thiol-disulfide isomerase/thioredoxin